MYIYIVHTIYKFNVPLPLITIRQNVFHLIYHPLTIHILITRKIYNLEVKYLLSTHK